MNIAMVHFRVGKLDGVSLEMDKWREVLEKKFGYNVIYLAGDLGQSDGYRIQELSLDHEIAIKIREKAFFSPLNPDEEKLLASEIRTNVDNICSKLSEFVEEHEINCFIPNNMFCYPLNIPASLALLEIIQQSDIPTIHHHHDFFWERTMFKPTCPLIKEFLDNSFPPNLPNMQHVVINSLAQSSLLKKRNIESSVIPNVFYFEKPDWIKDEFNSDLRKSLDIKNNDILILQATRIVKRKGIELIIDLIAELNKIENQNELKRNQLFNERQFQDDNIILVMPNLIEDTLYKEKLENKCKSLNVEYRFCNDFFAHQRSKKGNGEKIYSLWDAYTQADVVSYPSLLEGWGNQFLEAVKAKLPIILYEYDVYKEDIGPLGFNTISLGSKLEKTDNNGLVSIPNHLIEVAARKVINILHNTKERQEMVQKNFKIGSEHLSIKALGNYLESLLDKIS
jgi:glycosyltransferase involved in cell wall biosynthesis